MELSFFKRIIIFRQGQFGDTLVTFPIIEALHKKAPHTEIIYCTNNFRSGSYVQGGEVARLSPYISKIVTYDMEDNIVEKFFTLKRALKVTKRDLLVYLPYSPIKRARVVRDFLFFKALMVRHIVCVRETLAWTFRYERQSDILPKEAHRMRKFLSSAGISVQLPTKCSLHYDGEWAQQKWAEWGLNGKEVVAVCPGSKMQSKRWPIDRYIELGYRWNKYTGMVFVIVGGPEESEMAEGIIKRWPGYGFSACGATIAQTAGVLTKVKAYCGNDTGSMHLAAILGVPCVAIFSSREPAKLWEPLGEKNIVLRKKVYCGNCRLETCYATPAMCIEKISVNEVFEAMDKMRANL